MPSLENLVISAASSAGVVDIPESWYNLVRPGIIQYGLLLKYDAELSGFKVYDDCSKPYYPCAGGA
ncbi:MAG: hypothetical protein ACLUIQ_01710 [Dialister invisus]